MSNDKKKKNDIDIVDIIAHGMDQDLKDVLNNAVDEEIRKTGLTEEEAIDKLFAEGRGEQPNLPKRTLH